MVARFLSLGGLLFGLTLLAFGWGARSDTPGVRAQQTCDPNYQGVCLPVFTGVDNINCDSPEVTLSSFPASDLDPYGLDNDSDNVACEGNGRPAYQAPTATPTATPTRTNTPLPRARPPLRPRRPRRRHPPAHRPLLRPGRTPQRPRARLR